MRILIFAAAVLVVTVTVLGARRGMRLRAGPQPSRSATERWEDEGGALRGRAA